MPFLMLPSTHSRRWTACVCTSPHLGLHSQRRPSPPSNAPSCQITSPSVNQSCVEERPRLTGLECPSQTSLTQGMPSSLCCGRATPNQAPLAAGRCTRGGRGTPSLLLSHRCYDHSRTLCTSANAPLPFLVMYVSCCACCSRDVQWFGYHTNLPHRSNYNSPLSFDPCMLA